MQMGMEEWMFWGKKVEVFDFDSKEQLRTKQA